MAVEDNKGPRLEVAVVSSGATSGDFVKGGDSKATTSPEGIEEIDLSGLEEEEEGDEGAAGDGEKEEGGAKDDKAADSNDAPEAEAEGSGAAKEPPVGDLGEYDPANEELKGKFQERFWTEEEVDGKPQQVLNFAAITAELEANLKDGVENINKGTRAYLKDQLGISDRFIDEHIRGQLAIKQQAEGAFYDRVGGKEHYETMLDWGKGTYTAEQKRRFNAAMEKGGEDAADALDLLVSRYDKANPTAA